MPVGVSTTLTAPCFQARWAAWRTRNALIATDAAADIAHGARVAVFTGQSHLGGVLARAAGLVALGVDAGVITGAGFGRAGGALAAFAGVGDGAIGAVGVTLLPVIIREYAALGGIAAVQGADIAVVASQRGTRYAFAAGADITDRALGVVSVAGLGVVEVLATFNAGTGIVGARDAIVAGAFVGLAVAVVVLAVARFRGRSF